MSSTSEIYQTIRGFKFPINFSPETIESAIDFKAKNNDVVLCSYPRCGAHWTQQIIHLLRNNGKPYVDGLQFKMMCPLIEKKGATVLEKQNSPRFYRFHFNQPYLSGLNPTTKYIIVLRNPKDCLVSLYRFKSSGFHGSKNASFQFTMKCFLNGELPYGNYLDFMLWWYEHRHLDNVLIILYENMKIDPKSSIIKISQFLEQKMNPKLLDDVIRYSSFEYMKTNMAPLFEEIYTKYVFSEMDLKSSDLPLGLKYFYEKIRAKYPKMVEHEVIIHSGNMGHGKDNLTHEDNIKLEDEIKKKLVETDLYKFWCSIGCM